MFIVYRFKINRTYQLALDMGVKPNMDISFNFVNDSGNRGSG